MDDVSRSDTPTPPQQPPATEWSPPPGPPVAPPSTPPPGVTPPVYPPYQPPTRSKSRRGWIVALVVVSASFLMFAACVWSFVALTGESGTMGGVVRGDGIALIHLDGVIAGTRDSGSITPEMMIDMLDRADSDTRIKAILLRIDSPGGTVAASEEIASAVKRADKPVIASIGDVGASGAYMVASQCDEIVAVEGSSVGSIGVILQVANIEELAKKLGISVDVIKAGEYKDAGSMFRSLTATEQALLQKQVDDVYEQFIAIVAEGRDMPPATVRKLATGFVWSGTEAKSLGLIDTVGTYSDAVDRAAELGDISGEPNVITFDERPLLDIFDLLNAVSGSSTARQALDQLGRELGLQSVPE